MAHSDSTYQAVLFRGWEFVRLRYELDGDDVIVREKGTLRPETEKRVSIGRLDPDARRIWSRQPAYRASIILLLIVLAVLGYDLLGRKGGLSEGNIDWRIWGPGIAAAVLLWIVMYATRRPREWTHFQGTGGATGLFILQQRRDAAAHKIFVEKIRRRAERRQ